MQSLLKKHEAVENDFAVHKTRVQNVCAQGEDIISKVSSEGFVTFLKAFGPNTETRTVMKLPIENNKKEFF